MINKAIIKEVFTGLVLSLLVYFQYQINVTNKERISKIDYTNYSLDSLRKLNKLNKIEIIKQDSLINKLQIRLIDMVDDTKDSLTNEEFNNLRELANSEL